MKLAKRTKLPLILKKDKPIKNLNSNNKANFYQKIKEKLPELNSQQPTTQ
jgi:hypothetical protein